MSTIQKDQDESKKRGAYPYYGLAKCLELGRVVKELGGNTGAVSRALIAQQMRCEEDAAAFTQLIMAAKTFGIIEGRGEFTLTADGKRYFFPTSDGDKKSSQLAFLAAPTIFHALVEKFDGTQLPNPEMLGNLILNLGAPASWKQRVASMFISSLRDVGAIDAQGIVRFAASKHQAGSSRSAHAHIGQVENHSEGLANPSADQPPPPKPPLPPKPPEAGTINFPIGPDRFLTVPKDLTEDDCASIEIMLPGLKAYAKRIQPKPASEQ